MVEKNPFIEDWRDFWHSIYSHVASGEAARRYYSSKEFSLLGTSNVFTPMTPQFDIKFFDLQNTWYRFDIRPLKKSLEQFAKFPKATEWDDAQPRLLLISVMLLHLIRLFLIVINERMALDVLNMVGLQKRMMVQQNLNMSPDMTRASPSIMLLLVQHSQLTMIL
ncbi:MAG: hypothetical protein L0H53_16425 [Candidatus Nitrosocosmicus sp.]|nr:hypothetical protein [Candidatus Nitrosocosmicus sp.]MDN5868978.1 hypothetical protein [Candidatus Nitrosocosmicus sp.]